jgi:EAL domain-containing protein (putative c-di-GMP-specific phosphodiesterase class I)
MFIPTLESVKLIHKVDKYMIESVCKDLRRSMDDGHEAIPVSINFSRLDFELTDIITHLELMIEKYNIPKTALHVEITESALMDDTNVLEESAKKIKEAGYALWLDDFGSGYSSLNVLKDYEFDVMKLDMAFLKNFSNKNEKAKQLIVSIIQLANKLGMNTLCEGVETEEQRDFLKSVDCGRLQGYLFGKPMPYEEARDKIDNGFYTVSKNI